MTYLAQPARGLAIRSTQHARLAAIDFTQDDIVRPELRNDAILANRSEPKSELKRAPSEHKNGKGPTTVS